GTAQSSLDRSGCLDKTLLDRVIDGSAVGVWLVEIRLGGVAVGVELNQADLAMHLGQRAQLRQRDRVITPKVDRDDPGPQNVQEAARDPALRLLDVAWNDGQVAVVHHRQTVEDRDTTSAVVGAHQRRRAADVLRAEASADAVRSTGVER